MLIVKGLILQLIKFYQRYLSPDTSWAKRLFITDRTCRFSPTCSEYCYESIEKHGIIRGSWLCFRRVLRCHPWSKGGPDPVP